MASIFVSSNKEALCIGCRGINIESLSAPGGYVHTMSISELGPYQSCPLCIFIATYPRPGTESAVVGCQSRLQLSERAYLEICALGTWDEAPNYISTIFVRTRKEDPASAYGVPIIVDLTNTASEGSLQQAQSWLRECSSDHHDECGGALQFPDIEPIIHSRSTRNPHPTYNPDQASSPEQIPQAETKRRIDHRLLKWLRRPSSHSKGKESLPVIGKSDDGRKIEPGQTLESAHLNRNRSQSLKQRSQKPKRLIDLGAFDEGSVDAQLVEHYSLEDRYATLTYCWGNLVQGNFTTTSKTLNLRSSRIDYSVIPATFQHAFEITRGLGIRYIWIDALCILQDSHSDWEEESTKMGAIYSNSYVTIAADWSDSANGGCYNEASDTILEGNDALIRITCILSDDSKSSLYLGWGYGRAIPEIETSKLTTRAWAYQERVLSPRILHYTKKQLFWECRQTVLTEDMIPRKLTELHPAATLNIGQGYPLPGIIRLLERNSRKVALAGPLHLWYNSLISGGYAKRKLTVPSDKLPAISALARLWSQHIPGAYLAGLWHHKLWWGLCWRRKGGLIAKPLKYRCPSWSWAAVDCNVHWRGGFGLSEHDGGMIHIEETNVQLDGQDPFGRISTGFLKVSGRVESFYADGEHLKALNGEIIGTSFMDTDITPQLVQGLLLTRDPGENTALVLLLATVSSVFSGVVGFERKGLGLVSRSGAEPSVLEFFKNIEEQALTLI